LDGRINEVEQSSISRDTALGTRINGVDERITTEVNNRQAAITGVTNLINTERDARIEAVEQEAVIRQTQFNDLSSEISNFNDEVFRLDSRINLEHSERVQVIGDLEIRLFGNQNEEDNNEPDENGDDEEENNGTGENGVDDEEVIEGEVPRLDRLIDELSTRVDEIDMTALNERIDEVEQDSISRDDALSDRIDDANNDLSVLSNSLEDEKNNRQKQFYELSNLITTNTVDIASTKDDLVLLQEADAIINQAISDVQDDINGLGSRVATNEEDIADRLTESQVDDRITYLRPTNIPLPPIPEPLPTPEPEPNPDYPEYSDNPYLEPEIPDPVVVTYGLQATVSSDGTIIYNWVLSN